MRVSLAAPDTHDRPEGPFLIDRASVVDWGSPAKGGIYFGIAKNLSKLTRQNPPAVGKYLLNMTVEDNADAFAVAERLQVELTTLPPHLRSAEEDQLRKIGILNGNLPYNHILADPLGSKNPISDCSEVNSVADHFAKILADILPKVLSRVGNDLYPSLPSVRFSNLSAPLNISGGSPLNDLCNAFTAEGSLHYMNSGFSKSFEDGILQRCSNFGLEFPALYYTNFFRWQGAYKAQNLYNVTSTTISATKESIGESPRLRAVYGGPGLDNLSLRFVTNTLKLCLTQMRIYKTTSESDIYHSLRALSSKIPDPNFISLDFSGFDQSVNMYVIKTFIRAIKPVLDLFPAWRGHLETHFCRPTLAAPYFAGDTHFWLKNKGSLLSGSNMTSLFNWVINGVLNIAGYVKSQRVSPTQAFSDLGVKFDFVALGDDNGGLYSGPVGSEVADAISTFGFKTTGQAGLVFLMRYYDFDRGCNYNLVSRALSQTFWRERAPKGPIIESFGLMSRMIRTQNHPLHSYLLEQVENTSGFKRLYQAISSELGYTRPCSWSNFSSLVSSEVFADAFMLSLSKGGRVDVRNYLMGLARGETDPSSIVSTLLQSAPFLALTGRDISKEVSELLSGRFFINHRPTLTDRNRWFSRLDDFLHLAVNFEHGGVIPVGEPFSSYAGSSRALLHSATNSGPLRRLLSHYSKTIDPTTLEFNYGT